MFKRGSIFLFSVVGTLATLFALYFSLILAALLLPPDILYQSLFSLPVFLLASAVLMLLVGKHLGTKPDLEVNRPLGAQFATIISLINILMIVLAILLIYFGITTPMEALILSIFAYIGCLAIYKKYFWR